MVKEKKTKKVILFEKVLKKFEHGFVEINGKKAYLPVLTKCKISDLFIMIDGELEKIRKEELENEQTL